MLSAVALMIRSGFIVTNDPAATAKNLLANVPLYWFSFAADLLGGASYIVVTALFYRLFAPVNRNVSLVAMLFSTVGCAVGAASLVLHIAPLTILRSTRYSAAFAPEQLQTFAYLALKMRAQFADIGMVFFGVYCMLIGYLIVRSSFLPRALGVAVVFAGIGWFTLIVPPFATSLLPYLGLPGLIGEGSLMLWLLFAGVDADRSRAPRAAHA
jgi:hypothetical protein